MERNKKMTNLEKGARRNGSHPCWNMWGRICLSGRGAGESFGKKLIKEFKQREAGGSLAVFVFEAAFLLSLTMISLEQHVCTPAQRLSQAWVLSSDHRSSMAPRNTPLCARLTSDLYASGVYWTAHRFAEAQNNSVQRFWELCGVVWAAEVYAGVLHGCRAYLWHRGFVPHVFYLLFLLHVECLG